MPGVKELLRQSVRFGLVGGVNTSIGLAAIYTLMFFLGAGTVLANVIGYAVGFTVSFTLNRKWTFSSAQPVAHVLPKYFLMAVFSYLLNLGVVVSATHFLVNPYLAQLLGVGVCTVCMFLGCRWFVFAPSPLLG